MKKSLFATTAIVAAFGMGATGAQAQDASLNLSAFSNFYAAWADQDNPAGGYHQSDYDFSTNTEIEVNGEVTLDNGITAGMTVEIEADNNDGDGARDNIDENLIYVEGSFGTVELGNEDGAADTMMYGATSVKAVYEGTYNNTTGSLVNYGFSNAPVLVDPIDSGDSTKITYYTPRFAGIQFGVSHAPDGDADAVIPDRGALETTDQWEAGLNYVNSFNGFDVAASLTGAYRNVSGSTNLGSVPAGGITVGGITIPAGTTIADINVQRGGGEEFGGTLGGVIGFGGFEFGAAYGMGQQVVGAGRNAQASEEDYWTASAGAAYSTGPWSVSLTGMVSEQDIPGGGDDNFYEVNTGVNYALGSGVSVFASGAYGEENPVGNNNENEYVSLLSGVGVSF